MADSNWFVNFKVYVSFLRFVNLSEAGVFERTNFFKLP